MIEQVSAPVVVAIYLYFFIVAAVGLSILSYVVRTGRRSGRFDSDMVHPPDEG